MRIVVLIFAIHLLLHIPAVAQKEWNIWYFGNSAGLDFNSGAPVVLEGSAMSTLEGCASVADREGRPLFYTDGVSVWNRDHARMPNGFSLGGDSSATQSAIIVPLPFNNTVYYIFTVGRAESNPGAGLQYSIVDMNAPSGSGLGDVVEKNTRLLRTATEKLTAVRHRNGTDVWIITHEINSDVFYAWLLTPLGIQPTPITSAVGTVYEQGIGYLKSSPDGKRLAAAADFNLFELYDFNNATGKISNAVPIRTPIPHLCYGVEFSPDGRLLYGSKAIRPNDVFSPMEIWQYDLTAGTPEQIAESQVRLATFSIVNPPPGAIQAGPDGRLYIARSESRYLSVIAEPNVRGTGCTFIDEGIDLLSGESRYGLPNFHIATVAPEFLYTNICFGDSTRFTVAADLLPADSVFWDFGDPAVAPHDTASGPESAYLYKTPGVYTVLLTLWRDGFARTFSRDIAIAPPLTVDLGNDRSFCAGSALMLDAGLGKYDLFLWSTGASTASIIVREPGTYWVRVSDGLCEATDTLVVSVRVPEITIGESGAICRGGSIQLMASSSEAMTYQWEPPDDLNNPLVAMPVARPVTTTTYTVTATTSDGCSTTATVTVTVHEPVELELGADRTICAGGQAILDATTTGATYLWSTGETTPVISVARQGVYSVIITVGSCSATDAVAVNVIQPAIGTINDQTICRGGSVRLQAHGAASYEWSPGQGLDNPFAADPVATPQTTTTYRVIGTTNGGCRDTAFVTITVQENIVVDLGSDITICPGATARLRSPLANAVYRWSTGETTESITVSTPGIYSLTVTSGTCTGTDEIRVDVSTPSLALAATHLSLCRGDSVRLGASGTAAYQWTPTVGLDDPTAAEPLAFPTETTLYTVTGTDENGCTTTGSVTVEIVDDIAVRLALPDVTGLVGTTNFSIPLTIETDASLLPLSLRDLRVEVRIDASVFDPQPGPSATWRSIPNGRDLLLVVTPGEIAITQPVQVLAELTGTLLTGDSTRTPLRFGRLQHEHCISATTRPGSLLLEGCYPANRSIQLFAAPALSIAPNPAGDAAVLRVQPAAQGAARITIYTVEGKLVLRQNATLTGEEQAIDLPVHTLPAGLYRVALTTDSSVQATLLHIVR